MHEEDPQHGHAPNKADLDERACALAAEAGTHSGDERRAPETFEKTGEPVRDQSGAS